MTHEPSDIINKYRPRWKRIRDAIEGSTAIKAAGQTYLPKATAKQSDAAYELFKKYVSFYPATETTLKSLTGLILSRDPLVEAPDDVMALLPTIGYDGETFEELCRWTVRETLGVSYGGLLVDRPTGEASSLAEEIELGLVPYVAKFAAEDILEVKRSYSLKANRRVVSFVRLQEDENTQRHLILENGAYRVEIYTKPEGGSAGYEFAGSYVPLRKGKPLEMIPFRPITANVGSTDPGKPQIEDVVNINLDHYIVEGRIAYIQYWQSMAILFATGVDAPEPTPADSDPDAPKNDEQGFVVGSTEAWVFSNPQAKGDYAEFKGTGVESVERTRDKLEDRMAKIGAQVLGSEKAAAEAENTVMMRQQAEKSALAASARVAAINLSDVLQWVEWWMGVEDKDLSSKVTLNTNYNVEQITVDQLAALRELRASRDLSHRTFFEIGKRGGLYPEGLTYEEEQERIKEDRSGMVDGFEGLSEDDLAGDASEGDDAE